MSRRSRLALPLIEMTLYLLALVIALLKPPADPGAPFRIALYEWLIIGLAFIALGRFVLAMRNPKHPGGSLILLITPTVLLAFAITASYR